MDYLLKSSAVVAIFYLVYQMFMQRETFFMGNRWFLLSGLVLACFIPLLVIPIYVEATPSDIQSLVISSNVSETPTQVGTYFDFSQFLLMVYGVGAVFFLGKLFIEFISLFILLRKNSSFNDGHYTYIESETAAAPFSFFKWIVYNPSQFSSKELNLILNHEKVHARQFHSLDVILVQLACAFMWFNPFVWLYKTSLQQNLEFIADQDAQCVSPCEKSYQSLLLKTSISSHQLALTNNFYNSLIKKRIVMLHKSKSNRIHSWKYSLVLPLLAAFVFNFNTETIAQTKNTEPEKVKIGQNVLRFVITKDTKDSQLESIKQKLAEKDATIAFDNITRNDRKEITGIKIEFSHSGKSGNFFVNSDNPIKDVTVSLNVNENELTVGQSTKNLSQSFEVITEDGDRKVKTTGSGSNVFVYSTDDDDDKVVEKIVVVGKDGEEHEVKKERKVYVIKTDATKESDDVDDVVFVRKHKKDTVWIKKDVKNIVWTDDDGKDVEIIAVENDDKNIKIFTSGEEQPLIFLDGKEISKKDMDAIDPKNIESINVLKGEKAIEKHGKKAKDGVIEITSKKN